MMKKQIALYLCTLLATAGCSQPQLFENKLVSEAQVTDHTRAGDILASLPAPTEKIAVATYDFQDQTGQFKNNDKYTDYSSAVTKGGYSILIKALLDAGNKQWFTVTERGGLKNLLEERQIIKVMRNEYQGPSGTKLPNLPPLVYGGMMIEGGIVSYDSNIVTGGMGATYLGIGASAQYHRDMVTVYLRAINIQTGEVLLSVNSSKTLFSTQLDTNLLKYVTFDRLLQAEAGVSINEPTQLAVGQAIETAVYSLIMEGAINHMWDFKDPAAGQAAIQQYLIRRDGSNAHAAQAPASSSNTNTSAEAQALVRDAQAHPVPVAAIRPYVAPEIVPSHTIAPLNATPAPVVSGN